MNESVFHHPASMECNPSYATPAAVVPSTVTDLQQDTEACGSDEEQYDNILSGPAAHWRRVPYVNAPTNDAAAPNTEDHEEYEEYLPYMLSWRAHAYRVHELRFRWLL